MIPSRQFGFTARQEAKHRAPHHWFDCHLDLAYLAQNGRDMLREPPGPDAPGGPGAVTLRSLRLGGVTRAAATIFVQRRGPDADGQNVDGPWCWSDPDEAHRVSLAQFDIYDNWRTHNYIYIPKLDRHAAPLGILILIEGAAGIRSIDDLQLFYRRGARLLAMTWVDGTRWAGGDQSGGDITAEGRGLIAAADDLAMVHDASHLSEAAFWTLLATARRPVIASHSNCRSLLPGKKHPERHLSDPQIQALASAGGMIGLNLFSNFLASGRPATLADAIAHLQHIVELTGRTDIIGLGSDMDGGFTADKLPAPLRRPADLELLTDALHAVGFSDEHIRGFRHENWERFFTGAGLI